MDYGRDLWDAEHRRIRRRDEQRMASLTRRLLWQYGPIQTALIVQGRDPKTNADLERWRNLGRKDRP